MCPRNNWTTGEKVIRCRKGRTSIILIFVKRSGHGENQFGGEWECDSPRGRKDGELVANYAKYPVPSLLIPLLPDVSRFVSFVHPAHEYYHMGRRLLILQHCIEENAKTRVEVEENSSPKDPTEE